MRSNRLWITGDRLLIYGIVALSVLAFTPESHKSEKLPPEFSSIPFCYKTIISIFGELTTYATLNL